MARKVLVTGAAGFIGAFLVKKLLEESDDAIVGLDNLNSYYDPGIKDARLNMLAEVDTDAASPSCAATCATPPSSSAVRPERFDVVVNLAAQAASATPSRTRAPTSRATSSASSTCSRPAATTRSSTWSTPAPVRSTAATRRFLSPRRTASTRLSRSTPPPRSPTSSWRPPTQSSTPSRRPGCASSRCTAPWAGPTWLTSASPRSCAAATPSRFSTWATAPRLHLRRRHCRGRQACHGRRPRSSDGRGRAAPRRAPRLQHRQLAPREPARLVDTLQRVLVEEGVLPADYDFEAHKQLVPMQPGDVPVTYADTTALQRDLATSRDAARGRPEGLCQVVQALLQHLANHGPVAGAIFHADYCSLTIGE